MAIPPPLAGCSVWRCQNPGMVENLRSMLVIIVCIVCVVARLWWSDDIALDLNSVMQTLDSVNLWPMGDLLVMPRSNGHLAVTMKLINLILHLLLCHCNPDCNMKFFCFYVPLRAKVCQHSNLSEKRTKSEEFTHYDQPQFYIIHSRFYIHEKTPVMKEFE